MLRALCRVIQKARTFLQNNRVEFNSVKLKICRSSKIEALPRSKPTKRPVFLYRARRLKTNEMIRQRGDYKHF